MRKLKPGEVNKIFILGFRRGCGSTPTWCSNPRHQEGPAPDMCSLLLVCVRISPTLDSLDLHPAPFCGFCRD